MAKKILPILIIVLITLVSACKKDKEPEKIDYSYFPVNTNRWVIYDVTKTVYDEFKNGQSTTTNYQLMEKVVSTFKDNSGRETQRVEQYIKADSSSAWTLQKVLAVNRTTYTAERMEDNERFINFTFPVKQGDSWNGNSFNTRPEEDYSYQSIDKAEKIGVFSLPQVATVLQIDNENLLKKTYSLEKYAKNIGLVYKEFLNDSAKVIDTRPLKDRIIGGIELKMTLNSYSN
jgi:hypothetical protein